MHKKKKVKKYKFSKTNFFLRIVHVGNIDNHIVFLVSFGNGNNFDMQYHLVVVGVIYSHSKLYIQTKFELDRTIHTPTWFYISFLAMYPNKHNTHVSKFSIQLLIGTHILRCHPLSSCFDQCTNNNHSSYGKNKKKLTQKKKAIDSIRHNHTNIFGLLKLKRWETQELLLVAKVENY